MIHVDHPELCRIEWHGKTFSVRVVDGLLFSDGQHVGFQLDRDRNEILISNRGDTLTIGAHLGVGVLTMLELALAA